MGVYASTQCYRITNFFPSGNLHFSIIIHKVAKVREREGFIVIKSKESRFKLLRFILYLFIE